MGKTRFNAGWKTRHEASRHRRCIGCRHPIAFGDRCQDCRDRLRQRRKRKPR